MVAMANEAQARVHVTRFHDDRVHAKTVVFGFTLNDGDVAITEAALARGGSYTGEIHGDSAVITLREDGSVSMQRDGSTSYPIRLFWFAWYTFHPETDLIQ